MSTRSHVMESRLEMNNEDVASILPRLIENFSLTDIFTMDVTSLAFRRSPVANENSTEEFKVVFAINADATEKMIPGVVGSSELDRLHDITPYLGSSVYEKDKYDSIDAEVAAEIVVQLLWSVRRYVFVGLSRSLRNSYSFGGAFRTV